MSKAYVFLDLEAQSFFDKTKVTQPAVFQHSVITDFCQDDFSDEFSALVIAGTKRALSLSVEGTSPSMQIK